MRKFGVLILVIFGIAVTGCSDGASSSGSAIFKSVSPADAQRMMAERRDLLVVDVRSPQELRSGYIEGSTLIPFWEIAERKRTLPTDRPILLVCAVGGRSYAIGQALLRNGRHEIYNLSGGISAWKKAGLPLKY